jgi:hypothetical protein
MQTTAIEPTPSPHILFVLTPESSLETTPEVKYSAILNTKLHAPAARTLLIPHNPITAGNKRRERESSFV